MYANIFAENMWVAFAFAKAIHIFVHDSDGVLWFHVGRPCVHLFVCLSVVHLSIFRFWV